jgi:hypothetical protein
MCLWDKGFAFLIRDNGSVIPTAAFILDASSNPLSAKNVLGKIFNVLEQARQSDDAAFAKITTHEKKENVGVDYSMKVDMEALIGTQEEESVFKDVAGAPVSLQLDYGLDGDDVFYIGLNYFTGAGAHVADEKSVAVGAQGIGSDEKVVVSQVTQGSGVNLESDKEFKKMQGFISGYNNGVTYFVTAPVLNYMDRIVESNAKKGTLSAEDKLLYDNVRQYIVPVKSLIFGNAKATAGSVDTQGFLLIE